mmetsp:Transcript_64109/g.105843  ORF Transcript_64109/g.105843 Transcript_64109/m.105843 type:complete len:517 (-) Transcript_64109:30-1580(-)
MALRGGVHLKPGVDLEGVDRRNRRAIVPRAVAGVPSIGVPAVQEITLLQGPGPQRAIRSLVDSGHDSFLDLLDVRRARRASVHVKTRRIRAAGGEPAAGHREPPVCDPRSGAAVPREPDVRVVEVAVLPLPLPLGHVRLRAVELEIDVESVVGGGPGVREQAVRVESGGDGAGARVQRVDVAGAPVPDYGARLEGRVEGGLADVGQDALLVVAELHGDRPRACRDGGKDGVTELPRPVPPGARQVAPALVHQVQDVARPTARQRVRLPDAVGHPGDRRLTAQPARAPRCAPGGPFELLVEETDDRRRVGPRQQRLEGVAQGDGLLVEPDVVPSGHEGVVHRGPQGSGRGGEVAGVVQPVPHLVQVRTVGRPRAARVDVPPVRGDAREPGVLGQHGGEGRHGLGEADQAVVVDEELALGGVEQVQRVPPDVDDGGRTVVVRVQQRALEREGDGGPGGRLGLGRAARGGVGMTEPLPRAPLVVVLGVDLGTTLSCEALGQHTGLQGPHEQEHHERSPH